MLVLLIELPFALYKDSMRPTPYYALISCNAVSNCEQMGKFQTQESCQEMKSQLESMSKMNAYICEKAGK